MDVVRFSSFHELEVHAAVWDRLAADVPFRSWTWLFTWWHHYQAMGQLYVLAVFDKGDVVAIAPWYRTTTARHGRTIRFLGDVEVCSEYPTVLCRAGSEDAVSATLAHWLSNVDRRDRWDVVELLPIAPGDLLCCALARQMAERGCGLHGRVGEGCWRADLPATWEDYLRALSKDRRKKVRRMQRQFVDSGLVVWHTARTPEELAGAQEILVDLHQRRRSTFGDPGCFASRRYEAFQREVLPRLLRESRLGLHWAELDGRPIAAEYQLLGTDVVYCYQGGIEPDAADLSPGQIATLYTFKTAIEQGYRAVDFLRGDEPYKQRWRAQRCPTEELRIVARRATAQLHHVAWLAGCDAKQWLKSAMGAVHLR